MLLSYKIHFRFSTKPVSFIFFFEEIFKQSRLHSDLPKNLETDKLLGEIHRLEELIFYT
jgi:hypothetical protein